MYKRIAALFLAIVMVMALAACGTSADESYNEGNTVSENKVSENTDQTWAIYLYLCGTDLEAGKTDRGETPESGGGAATRDLKEVMQASLPDNVTFVMQTGGTNDWLINLADPNYIERFVYNNSGAFEQVDQQPLASMGAPETFADFLSFCTDNYPADRRAVLFWDHGNGATGNICYDQVFNNDALTLAEIGSVMEYMFEADTAAPYFEVVGFDACQMASINVAETFVGYGRYLVASEENEPGCGWDYAAWLSALGSNPGMNGAELGTVICDSFKQSCTSYGVGDKITLSVVDLEKVQTLSDNFNSLGAEVLLNAAEDSVFINEFARCANEAEKYGGNTKKEGFGNLVDIGHLVKNAHALLPGNSETVLSALDECVIYEVHGDFRRYSNGLSCIFPYDASYYMRAYDQRYTDDPMSYFYYYFINGEMSEAGEQYLAAELEMAQAMPETPRLDASALEGCPLTVTEEGYATLTLGPDMADTLASIFMHLLRYAGEGEDAIFLGRDIDVTCDWEQGIFQDNFRNVWGSIDGNFVSMDISFSGDGYNLYVVPILLNGVDCNLDVAYDYDTESYLILGASLPVSEGDLPEGDIILLEDGDVITPLFEVYTEESGEYEWMAAEPFTYTANSVFEDIDMGDGAYALMFEIEDVRGESAFTNPVFISVNNGEIYLQEAE